MIRNILIDFRKKHHYSQQEMAQKIGISHLSYWKLENELSFPREATLRKIAEVIHWDYETLKKVIKGE